MKYVFLMITLCTSLFGSVDPNFYKNRVIIEIDGELYIPVMFKKYLPEKCSHCEIINKKTVILKIPL